MLQFALLCFGTASFMVVAVWQACTGLGYLALFFKLLCSLILQVFVTVCLLCLHSVWFAMLSLLQCLVFVTMLQFAFLFGCFVQFGLVAMLSLHLKLALYSFASNLALFCNAVWLLVAFEYLLCLHSSFCIFLFFSLWTKKSNLLVICKEENKKRDEQ